MEDNLTNAINQLQNMLSSDEGKKDLENMLGSFGIGEDSVPTEQDPVFNAENIIKMKSVMDTFQRRDDPRSQLLLALKPYLSNTRSARLETAIRLLSIGKLPAILKTFNGQE